ncbi:VOC family protein [Novosphingobium sp.]|uniref:VOC family protein n=1 Tax=Novosphingobium sp. TaxID=1874826 RepID=UPI0038B89669
MSLIRIEDIAHVRFAAPDLAAMRAFLVDFGLEPFEQAGRLFGRGSDGRPFVHATQPGKAGFIALGLRAGSIADLERLAQAEGVSVEPFDAPGAGFVVRLHDPDGFLVEVVAGQDVDEPRPGGVSWLRNAVVARVRQRDLVRLESGPAHVFRIGHCVLKVSDFRRSERWYKQRFGFLTSDEIEAAPQLVIGAFLRCDRGDVPSDHHTLFLAQLPGKPGFMHAAFEVLDLDDLMLGHQHLKARQRKAAWGVGRHIMGSQIFDYWKDPWGHELEHWTDGDLLTAHDPPQTRTLIDLLAVQWGAPNPLFTRKLAPSPRLAASLVATLTRLRNRFASRSKDISA